MLVWYCYFCGNSTSQRLSGDRGCWISVSFVFVVFQPSVPVGGDVPVRRDSDVSDGCTYSFKVDNKSIGVDLGEFVYDFG